MLVVVCAFITVPLRVIIAVSTRTDFVCYFLAVVTSGWLNGNGNSFLAYDALYLGNGVRRIFMEGALFP